MNNQSKKFFTFIDSFLNTMTKNSIFGKTYEYNENDFKNFSNEFLDLLNSHSWTNVPAKSFFTFDQQLRPYRYTPKDQDFNKNYEIVFSGCSQTLGHYIIPEIDLNKSSTYGHEDSEIDKKYYSNIWGFQVASKYKKEALNLGIGGFGAESILKGLMHHFQKNGNPKVLLVLYPDFGRMEGIDSDKIKMITPLNDHDIVQHWYLQPIDDKNFQEISKIPHSPRNVITWTHSLYRNLQSIMFLNEYCKQNNIYFKYSSWDYTANIFLKLLKEHLPEYSNYVEPTTLDFVEKTFNNLNCHELIKKKNDIDVWNIGNDGWHIGVHQHTHVADQFIKEIDIDNPWN